jgi:hypothetical protein
MPATHHPEPVTSLSLLPSLSPFSSPFRLTIPSTTSSSSSSSSSSSRAAMVYVHSIHAYAHKSAMISAFSPLIRSVKCWTPCRTLRGQESIVEGAGRCCRTPLPLKVRIFPPPSLPSPLPPSLLPSPSLPTPLPEPSTFKRHSSSTLNLQPPTTTLTRPISP